MHWDGSSVMFPLGSWGVSDLATSDSLTQMTQLGLILPQLPSRQLTCASTQGEKNDLRKGSISAFLYIILQQPIRAKLYWWLLNLSFKNREATSLYNNSMTFRLSTGWKSKKTKREIGTWTLQRTKKTVEYESDGDTDYNWRTRNDPLGLVKVG